LDLQQRGTGTASEFRDGLLTHLLLAGDLNLGHSHEESSHDAALTGLKAEYRLVAQNEDRVDDPLTLAPITAGSADRIRVDAQPSTDEGPPRILEMMSLLDGFTCGPPCRAVLDRTHGRTVRATSHRTLNLGDRSDADTEAQAQPFRQKEVRAQGESESVGEGRRDRLQLITHRGARVPPPGPVRLRRLGAGESYAAWLLCSGNKERVVRIPRRPLDQLPRSMAAEFAALEQVPPDLGASAVAIALETGSGGIGGPDGSGGPDGADDSSGIGDDDCPGGPGGPGSPDGPGVSDSPGGPGSTGGSGGPGGPGVSDIPSGPDCPGNPLGIPYMVTTYVPGRVLAPGDWRPEFAAPLAAQIARLHLALSTVSGESALPGAPTQLPTASQEGETLLSWWREHHPRTLLDPRVVALLDPWRRALGRFDHAFEGALTHPLIHGDAVLTNIVFDAAGVPRLIDFEWAGPGDPAKDLALIGGAITGGPWYAPMERTEVTAFVSEYARCVQRLSEESAQTGAVPQARSYSGDPMVWRPDAHATDPQALLARRDAWELLDRLPNLLYCLSRAEESPWHARWADDLSTGLSAALTADG